MNPPFGKLAINAIRKEIHNISPFKSEPVDFVRWIKNDEVCANDYNPNTVAPPEMELLRHSISHDGYTQPIVGWKQEVGYDHSNMLIIIYITGTLSWRINTCQGLPKAR